MVEEPLVIEDTVLPIKPKSEFYFGANRYDTSKINKFYAMVENSEGKTVYIDVIRRNRSINLGEPGETITETTEATGNIGLAKAAGTLMGELGPELVVSNGRYFVVG